MDTIPSVMASYIAGLRSHDVERIAGAVADELAFVTPDAVLRKAEFLAMLRALYAAFPDWHYEHGPPQVAGQIVTIRWRQAGTHTGTFAWPGLRPVPPTGRRVQIPEHEFQYTIRRGKIVEIRPEPIPGGAPRGILEQIGVPWPPR
jgi:predicted ester cyclase